MTLQASTRLRAPGAFSEELLETILRGVSAQKYAETVLQAGEALGVSPSAVSRKLVDLTATRLKEFQERSLGTFKPFAIFLERCAIDKSRHLQRHLAKPYRKEAHRGLMTALEQARYADARRMLRELEAWLRAKRRC